MKMKIGDQKIDILIKTAGDTIKLVYQHAFEQAISLC